MSKKDVIDSSPTPYHTFHPRLKVTEAENCSWICSHQNIAHFAEVTANCSDTVIKSYLFWIQYLALINFNDTISAKECLHNLGPLHTWAKSRDLVMVRTFDSQP